MAKHKPYISMNAAAKLVGCSRSTIQRAVLRGDLTAYNLATIDAGPFLLRREAAAFRPRPRGWPKGKPRK